MVNTRPKTVHEWCQADTNGRDRPNFGDAEIPTGIDAVDRVVVGVNVFVKARRVGTETFEGVHRPETACVGVVVAGAQIVETKIEIKLFAAKEVNVRGAAAGGDEVAKGVVV